MADFQGYWDHVNRTGLAVVQLRTLAGEVVARDEDGATPEPDAGPLAEGVVRAAVGALHTHNASLAARDPVLGPALGWDFDADGAKDRENGPAPDNITGPSLLHTIAGLAHLDRILREPVIHGEPFTITSIPSNQDATLGALAVPDAFNHATKAQSVWPAVFPVATGRRDANGDIIDPAGMTFLAAGDDGADDVPTGTEPDYPAGSKLVDPGPVESG